MQEEITEVQNVSSDTITEPLIDVDGAERKKTRILLGECLIQLNEGNRVRFFVSAGRGDSTVQCLRVMLSRVRQNLEHKGRLRKHFRLHSHVCRWTGLDGFRKDCVTLWRSTSQTHSVLETLEDLINRDKAA